MEETNSIKLEQSLEENNTTTNNTELQKSKKIDHLREDKPIPGQNFVCISFVSPEGVRNTTIRGLKIRGVFDKYEDAQEHAKNLQEEDPSFHIYVGEVGKWLPWDPSPEDKSKVKNSQYYEEELQKLVKGYEDNRERAKKSESDRKRELLQKSLQAAKKKQEQDKTDNKKGELKKKVQERKIMHPAKTAVGKNEISKDQVIDESVEQREKNLLLEKERINKDSDDLKKNEENLKSLDTNLNKLKEIYSRIQEKKANDKSVISA